MSLAEGPAWTQRAPRRWMHVNAAFVATKRDMSAVLANVLNRSADLNAHAINRLSGALQPLLPGAVGAGEICDDIGPEDILRTIVGLHYIHDAPAGRPPCGALSMCSSTACRSADDDRRR